RRRRPSAPGSEDSTRGYHRAALRAQEPRRGGTTLAPGGVLATRGGGTGASRPTGCQRGRPMPTFKYEAMDTSGGEVKDTVDAMNEEEAQQKIRQMGYFVTKITEMQSGKKGGKKKGAKKKKGKVFTIGGVSAKHLCTFTRQFSTLQDAG